DQIDQSERDDQQQQYRGDRASGHAEQATDTAQEQPGERAEQPADAAPSERQRGVRQRRHRQREKHERQQLEVVVVQRKLLRDVAAGQEKQASKPKHDVPPTGS